jgi:hypothetical protein
MSEYLFAITRKAVLKIVRLLGTISLEYGLRTTQIQLLNDVFYYNKTFILYLYKIKVLLPKGHIHHGRDVGIFTFENGMGYFEVLFIYI